MDGEGASRFKISQPPPRGLHHHLLLLSLQPLTPSFFHRHRLPEPSITPSACPGSCKSAASLFSFQPHIHSFEQLCLPTTYLRSRFSLFSTNNHHLHPILKNFSRLQSQRPELGQKDKPQTCNPSTTYLASTDFLVKSDYCIPQQTYFALYI